MKTKSIPIKILATVLVALFVFVCVVSLAASELNIMDGYVVALSGTVNRTLEYDDSYIFSTGLSDGAVYETGKITSNAKVEYSFDLSNGIEYTYES